MKSKFSSPFNKSAFQCSAASIPPILFWLLTMLAVSEPGHSQRPTMGNFIGVNTRSTDPLQYTNKFSSIREYHEWSLDAGFDDDGISNCPKNWLAFNPSNNGSSPTNFDNFYQQLSGRISPSMKWLAPEMRGLTQYNSLIQEQKPICLEGFPGVGNANGLYAPENAAEAFKLSQITRDISHELLNSSPVYPKNYIYYSNGPAYSITINAVFSGNCYGPAIKLWVDKNGDGSFDDQTEVVDDALGSGNGSNGISWSANPGAVSATFNFPSNLSPNNKYFRLRVAAISNGGLNVQPNDGGQEVFSYDVALINPAASGLTLNNYKAPTTKTDFNKGYITKVTCKRNGTSVYEKNLVPNPSYNYFNDGGLARFYTGTTYNLGLTGIPKADFGLDLNFDGSIIGGENTTFPTSTQITIPGNNPLGLTVMRITHRNASNAIIGIWEYPAIILDAGNNIGTNLSSYLTNISYTEPITTSSTPYLATHAVKLPIDQQAPATYLDYAKWVTIMAARYGHTNVCSAQNNPYCDLLRYNVIDNDVLGLGLSGLGNLNYLELGNEPDKWWYDGEFKNTPDAAWQMMPEQLAALMSAAYDGNDNSAGLALPYNNNAHYGVKNVDSGIKVVMGGISEFRGQYLLRMITAAAGLRQNAAKKLPFDVLNVHHYMGNDPNIGAAFINNDGMWNALDYDGLKGGGPGYSPEKCEIKKRYNAFYNRLMQNAGSAGAELAGIENWLSEFGYDTNGSSPVRAQLESGNQSYFTTQAQWLVRTYLELSAVEASGLVINKAHMFDLRDGAPYKGSNPNYSTGGLFEHCGLLTNDFKPKRSWYYVQTLKNVLGSTTFTKDLNPEGSGQIQFDNGGEAPRIYYYKNGSERYLAIWSPTANLSNNKELTLNEQAIRTAIGEGLNDAYSQFTIIQIKDNSEVGFRKGYSISNHQILFKPNTVLISETPIFVLLGESITDPDITCPLTGSLQITPYCNSARLKWDTNANPNGSWKIYVAKRSAIDPLPYKNCNEYTSEDVLGNSFIRTHTDHLQADRKHFLLEGLEANTDYVVFMVYVNENGIAMQTPCVQCFSTNNNTPCIINPCLKVEATGDCHNAFVDYCNLVVPNTGAAANPACAAYASPACTSGNPAAAIGCDPQKPWLLNPTGKPDPLTEMWSFCNLATVTVTFKNYVVLDAIKFYHDSGIDPVQIYYSDCDCPDTKKYLTTYVPSGYQDWVTLTENLPLKPVKKLYFYKVPSWYGVPDVKIGALHFCGEEVTDCNMIIIADSPTVTEGTFTDVWLSDQRKNDVRLNWKPVQLVRENKSLGDFQEYEVYLKKRVAGQTTMFSPSDKRLAFQYPGIKELSLPLNSLDDTATYDVLLRVPPRLNCIGVVATDNTYQSRSHGLTDYPEADTVISFSLRGLDARASKIQPNAVEPTGFSAYPNPTSGHMNLAWEGAGYTKLLVFNSSGIEMGSFRLPKGQNTYSFSLEGFAPGIYLLQLKGEGHPSMQKTVVLARS